LVLLTAIALAEMVTEAKEISFSFFPSFVKTAIILYDRKILLKTDLISILFISFKYFWIVYPISAF